MMVGFIGLSLGYLWHTTRIGQNGRKCWELVKNVKQLLVTVQAPG